VKSCDVYYKRDAKRKGKIAAKLNCETLRNIKNSCFRKALCCALNDLELFLCV